MFTTADERNHYFMSVEKEDMFITRNGEKDEKLMDSLRDRRDIARTLFGSVPAEMTLEGSLEERREKI